MRESALMFVSLAITQAAVKRQLSEEDAVALNEGTATALHEKLSESGVVITGIELEDQQLVRRSYHACWN